jgi:hypothetical protein
MPFLSVHSTIAITTQIVFLCVVFVLADLLLDHGHEGNSPVVLNILGPTSPPFSLAPGRHTSDARAAATTVRIPILLSPLGQPALSLLPHVEHDEGDGGHGRDEAKEEQRRPGRRADNVLPEASVSAPIDHGARAQARLRLQTKFTVVAALAAVLTLVLFTARDAGVVLAVKAHGRMATRAIGRLWPSASLAGLVTG